MTFTLTAEKREEKGKKLKKLREEGQLPGVVYGPKDEATAMSLDRSTFEKVYKEAGESTIIDLKGLGDDKEVLIHEVAVDPVMGTPLHVDLYAIERGKKLRVNVSLEFVGEAPAEKVGASITKVVHELEIESLPRNLPSHIEVDLSTLKEINDQIQVADLSLPEGVEIMANQDDVVAVASEVVEEVEETPEAVDMDAIEVEQKGKDEAGQEGESKAESGDGA